MSEQTLSPTLQGWHNKGQLFELEDQQIFTIDEGDKALPVIVLIHGFPTSSWDFEKIWSSLRANYRIVTLDMLGFGFSEKPNKRNYTISKQADLFVTLLAKLDVDEFHMLVHDYGVSVAQELLARQKQGELNSECLSCCFLNGGLFPETHKILLIQKLLLGPLGKFINKISNFTLFTKSFNQLFGETTKPSEEELQLFWEAITYNQGRHMFYNLITYIHDRKTHRQRWVQALQQSQIPLALINGSVDPVSGAHLVERYKELNCRLDYLLQLETVGHYPQFENASAVSSAYLEFLTTQHIQPH